MTLATATVLGVFQLSGVDCLLLFIPFAVYAVGVQLPTPTVNVPLNNYLQQQDLKSMNAAALSEVRREFESPWTHCNALSTVFALLASVLLIVLCLRL